MNDNLELNEIDNLYLEEAANILTCHIAKNTSLKYDEIYARTCDFVNKFLSEFPKREDRVINGEQIKVNGDLSHYKLSEAKVRKYQQLVFENTPIEVEYQDSEHVVYLGNDLECLMRILVCRQNNSTLPVSILKKRSYI